MSNLTRAHPGVVEGDHAISAAGWLSGVLAKRTQAEDVLAGTTIDQIVAKEIGQETPFPSLEVATADFTGVTNGLANDQGAFAEFCYGSMISCKDGNLFACARNTSHYTNY